MLPAAPFTLRLGLLPCSMLTDYDHFETKCRPILSLAPRPNCLLRRRLRVSQTDKSRTFCRSSSIFAPIDNLQPFAAKYFAPPTAGGPRTKCKNPRVPAGHCRSAPFVRHSKCLSQPPRSGTAYPQSLGNLWHGSAARHAARPPNPLAPGSHFPTPHNRYSPNLPTADMSLLGNVDFVYQLR